MAKTPRVPRQREKVVEGEIIEIDGVKMQRRGDVLFPAGDQLDPERFDSAIEEADYLAPALQGILTELGAADDEAKVTVSKIEIQGGIKKQAFLFECHPNEFNAQDVQEAYGPGDYQIRVYGKQEGTNYKVIHANKKITIGPTREQAKAKQLPAPVAAAPQDGSNVAKAIAEALAPVMAAQAALLQQVVGKGSSRADTLAEFKMMAELFKPASSGGELSSLKTALELVRPLMGEKGGAGLDEESGPYAVILKALETFAPALAAKAAGPGTLQIEDKSNKAAAPAAGAAAQPTEEEQMKIALRMQLAVVLNAAKMESDPQMYAALIYENAPDDLLAKLQGETWFAELCDIEPGFKDFKPWCEKVRAEVLEEIKAANAPESAELTASAEAGKTARDAKPVAGSAK
jgi:hypothetical protein